MSYTDDQIRNLAYRIEELNNFFRSQKGKGMDEETKSVIEFNSMLKALELGLITKEEVQQSDLYYEFKRRNSIKEQTTLNKVKKTLF